MERIAGPVSLFGRSYGLMPTGGNGRSSFVIKICPRCRRTFSGGTVCLHCQHEVALLDLAEPAVRRAHLRGDGELRATIRTYYGARSAMLMLFVGILFGLALGT